MGTGDDEVEATAASRVRCDLSLSISPDLPNSQTQIQETREGLFAMLRNSGVSWYICFRRARTFLDAKNSWSSDHDSLLDKDT